MDKRNKTENSFAINCILRTKIEPYLARGKIIGILTMYFSCFAQLIENILKFVF